MARDSAERRSGCPIATTLDLVGDRWSLVLVRDLLNGKRLFKEFLDSPERVSASVLTDRLEQLERHGLVVKTPYQQRPRRFAYALSEKGEALVPVLQAMCRWAARYEPGVWTPPESFMTRRPPN